MNSNARMTDEARKAKAEYMKEWRKRNPGKQAEYQERYWTRKAMERNNKEPTTEDRKED